MIIALQSMFPLKQMNIIHVHTYPPCRFLNLVSWEISSLKYVTNTMGILSLSEAEDFMSVRFMLPAPDYLYASTVLYHSHETVEY